MMNFDFSKIKGIKSVILYGSRAKGNNDDFSDTDVLVIASGLSNKNLELIKKEIAQNFNNQNLDISIYLPEDFEIMLKSGSLFLWHVKLDGVILYGLNKEELFADLKEFKGIYEDILLYHRLFLKAKLSLNQNNANYFDLNQLALLARNTLILLCYNNNKPHFGKYDVFDECKKMFTDKFPLNETGYCKLQLYRAFYKRGVNYIDLPSHLELMELIDEVEKIVELTLNNLELYNSIDRVYYLLKNRIDRNLYASYEIFTEFERDLFLSLRKIVKKELNEDFYGLEAIHRNRLDLKKGYNVSIISLGLDIYDSLKNMNKKLATYGPNGNDIFYLGVTVQSTVLGINTDTIFKIMETNWFIDALKNSKTKVINDMANLLINKVENSLKVEFLLFKINKYRNFLKENEDYFF